MTDYGIVLPVQSQSISASGFGVPVKTAIEDLDARLSLREALENLPDGLTNQINGQIVVTSTSFAALPSPGPLNVVFTNPSSIYDLEVDVSYSAWMVASASDVRAGVAATGGLTFQPAAFNGGSVMHSDNLFVASTSTIGQQATIPVVIPAGASAVTFSLQGMRGSASGVQNVNYPILRVKPRAYRIP